MSANPMERIQNAGLGKWRISGWTCMGGPDVDRVIELYLSYDGEYLRVSISPDGRWWRLGSASSSPKDLHIKQGLGRRGYKGRDYLERMVRDATRSAVLAAGLREED